MSEGGNNKTWFEFTSFVVCVCMCVFTHFDCPCPWDGWSHWGWAPPWCCSDAHWPRAQLRGGGSKEGKKERKNGRKKQKLKIKIKTEKGCKGKRDEKLERNRKTTEILFSHMKASTWNSWKRVNNVPLYSSLFNSERGVERRQWMESELV